MTEDPVEAVIADALRSAGIEFVTEDDQRAKRLDFYLPSLDTHIEVKRFHADRVLDQMKRSDNIIVVVGMGAARALAKMISGEAT